MAAATVPGSRCYYMSRFGYFVKHVAGGMLYESLAMLYFVNADVRHNYKRKDENKK